MTLTLPKAMRYVRDAVETARQEKEAMKKKER
nr:MAG TPA: hypothetical protein [Caudoviricetes sp.]DAY49444.1 MAG TPA: hypothetical protein [Caudoviricetes sp.]